METIKHPDFVIYFEGKDITKDIKPYIIEIIYTDNVSEADSLEIILDNTTKEFTTNSFPTTNLEIKLYIKHLDTEEYIYCGSFRRDNFERMLYLVSIKATSIIRSSDIKKTKKNRTFKNTSLSHIISQIANENSLQPIIKIEKDIPIQDILQQNETDSQFIEKLARKYGYYQKITPEKLFFIHQNSFKEEPPIAKIKETNLIDCNLTDNSSITYKKAVVFYHDPIKNKDFKYEYIDKSVKTGETLKINQKVESLEEAKELAKATLKDKNKQQSGSITVEGNPFLVTGSTIELDTGDVFSGTYLIESSEHRINQQGYTTTLKIRKI